VPKPNSDAPATFEDVDNPAGWSVFTFAARYDKKNKYTAHFSPCGAKVLPLNADGEREIDWWKFHYTGWEADEFSRDTYVRGSANANNDLLKKFGINKDTKDILLHWYQLLFPICDPAMSGIKDDGRMPFYTHAAACSNIYAYAAKN
jgi:hypothetical protein